jgi:dimethylhistidine N-methyltransferase
MTEPSAASLAAATGDIASEVLAGLQDEPKHIAPKYFYDAQGAALFDAITALDEYYVTRVERSILEEYGTDICAAIGTGSSIVEPGAGSCEKIGWLLPALAPSRYTALDISTEHLAASAARLQAEFPGMSIAARTCDHTRALAVDGTAGDAPLVFFYPGSSIGNFEPADAVAFLRGMRSAIDAGGQGGGLLIGVDAKKDEAVLNAAYNDRDGITRRFNLNVLDHLNALLDGNLDTARFAHAAWYNARCGRVEMHLRCRASHTAVLAGEELAFTAGELIHTENSYKYHPQEFTELAGRAGFTLRQLWQDSRRWFSVMYFTPAGSPAT